MKPLSEKTFVAPVRVTLCRRPGCGRIAECRGLCACDYRVAHGLVAEGVISWEVLEKTGKANEPKRTAKAWFLEHAGRS